MRGLVRAGLVLVAGLFLLWEGYGAIRWLQEAGDIGSALDHLWRTLHSDWMARVAVSDLLIIAAVALAGLWIDSARQGWPPARRVLLAAGFVVLGSPVLLFYLAWRLRHGARRLATRQP